MRDKKNKDLLTGDGYFNLAFTCPICGKHKYRSDEWVYKRKTLRADGKNYDIFYFCSYKCMTEYDKKIKGGCKSERLPKTEKQ